MDILKQVKEILAQRNPQEKDSQLSQLSDVLEYHHGLKETDIIECIKLLLSATFEEEDKNTRETFIRTIATAVGYHDMRNRIDWDRFVTLLPSLGNLELPYALDILGFSGQVKYLPILEEYVQHTDPEVSEWADDAIDNITSRQRAFDIQRESVMSRYANFACMDCKISIFLGKAIFHEDERINYFHIGEAEEPLNWQRPELNQIIWKMFADHARHALRVLVEGDDDYEELADFNKIGGSRIADTSEEDYLKGWDGLRGGETSS